MTPVTSPAGFLVSGETLAAASPIVGNKRKAPGGDPEALKRKISSLQQKCADYREKYDQAKKEEQEAWTERNRIAAMLFKERDSFRLQQGELEGRIGLYHADRVETSQKNRDLQIRIIRLQEEQERAEVEIHRLSSSCSELVGKNQALATENHIIAMGSAGIVEQNRDLQTRLQESDSEIKRLSGRCSELLEKKRNLVARNDRCRGRRDELGRQNKSLIEQNDELRKRRNALQRENEVFRAAFAAVSQPLSAPEVGTEFSLPAHSAEAIPEAPAPPSPSSNGEEEILGWFTE